MCCGIKEDEKKVLLDQQQMERMMSWGLYGYGVIVFTELGSFVRGAVVWPSCMFDASK